MIVRIITKLRDTLKDRLTKNQEHDERLRLASWLVVAAITIGATCFVAGYFWGKGSSAIQWSAGISREAFADQIYNSLLLTIADTEEGEDGGEGEKETATESAVGSAESAESESESETETSDSSDPDEFEDDGGDQEGVGGGDGGVVRNLPRTRPVLAQLAGFSKRTSAEALAARVTLRKVPVAIRDRTSITASGKRAVWYQVVTGAYKDRRALNSAIAIIKEEERLRDVRIVEC